GTGGILGAGVGGAGGGGARGRRADGEDGGDEARRDQDGEPLHSRAPFFFGVDFRVAQVRYLRVELTLRPSASVTVMRTLKRPLGSPRRSTVAVSRTPRITFVRLPLTDTSTRLY